ncbi:MAG: hypothetical protein LBQ27_00520, partial [Clostridiales bacterium]|nr:hypothetical protein [Clostridiales bacterium]
MKQKNRYAWGTAFLLTGVIGLAFEIILLASKVGAGYLAHMSIIVNLLADIWLIVTAATILLGFGKEKKPHKILLAVTGSRAQGALTTYLLAVSAVFWILVIASVKAFVGEGVLSGWVGVANIINMVVIPTAFLLTWIFFPTDRRLGRKIINYFWMIPPYVYFLVIVIISLASNSYIYNFLDPRWAYEVTGGS